MTSPAPFRAEDRADDFSEFSRSESHLRSEYSLSDFRDQSAEKVMDVDHHYEVKGMTKVDGEKYPFTCESKERHVTSVNYSGPEPEGMGTAEKLAIGAAAAVAAGLIASEMSNDDDEKHSEASPTGKYSTSDYDATTSLRCSINKPTHDKHCPAGINRGDGGSASIRITKPVGTERTLNFDKDDVTTPDGGRLDWGKQVDE